MGFLIAINQLQTSGSLLSNTYRFNILMYLSKILLLFLPYIKARDTWRWRCQTGTEYQAMFVQHVQMHIPCYSLRRVFYLFFPFGHTHSIWKFRRPGIKPTPQQQPALQKWWCWVLNLLNHRGTPGLSYLRLMCPRLLFWRHLRVLRITSRDYTML